MFWLSRVKWVCTGSQFRKHTFCSVLVIQDIQLFVIWISQSTAKIESNQWNSSLYILQPCNKIRTQLYGIYLSWDIETSYPVLQLLPRQEKNTYNKPQDCYTGMIRLEHDWSVTWPATSYNKYATKNRIPNVRFTIQKQHREAIISQL